MSSLFLFLVIMLTAECRNIAEDVFVTNLDDNCLKCLCISASDCDLKIGCQGDSCGPFQLSKSYWEDAGKPVLNSKDDPKKDSNRAFKNCASSYECSKIMIKQYFSKLAKDCNNDGLTNCDDYGMIQFNGGFQCNRPLNRNADGKRYLKNYNTCKPK